MNLFTALIFVLTAVVFVLVYLGPYRNPGWLSPGFAVAGDTPTFGFIAASDNHTGRPGTGFPVIGFPVFYKPVFPWFVVHVIHLTP